MKRYISDRWVDFAIISAVGWIISGLLIFNMGNANLFLMINKLHHPTTDMFFRYFTHLGDGVFYILVIIIFLFVNKRWFFHLLSGFIFTSIISRIGKDLIFTEALRPKKYFEESNIIIRTIQDMDIHHYNSFPSGHTMMAFSLFLLLGLYLDRKRFVIICAATAWLVAFSRVYLSQHFPIDVLVGSGLGFITTTLSYLWVENLIQKGKLSNPDKPYIKI
ncbi:MAG: phosphatase PAP2 family protein [Saprospiraceae bacterium]|nr:phosphatase PAP2 family protein [Saprospiraceae bacterium]